MEIISDSKLAKVIEYELEFTYNDQPGSGYSFPCDKDGNVNRESLHTAGQENLDKCLSGEYDVSPGQIVGRSYTVREPAIGICACGAQVVIDGDTSCDNCHRLYNGAGQELESFGSYSWCSENGETYYEEDY